MTDKERILFQVLRALASARYHVDGQYGRSYEKQGEPGLAGCSGHETHIACFDEQRLRVGDLVLCATSGRWDVHDCQIGFVDIIYGEDRCLIREIGGSTTRYITNERFERIVGIDPHLLYEGRMWAFYRQAQKAVWKIDEYNYCWGGLEYLWQGEPVERMFYHRATDARIWLKPRWFRGEDDTILAPFAVTIERWRTRRTIKGLAEELRANGLGTHAYERIPRSQNPFHWTYDRRYPHAEEATYGYR